MARQEIGGVADDNNLNKVNHNFIELYDGVQDASGKINKVEKDINERMDNFIDETSDTALGKVVDNAKLNWKEPVNNFNDLPNNAQKGDTSMARDSGKVYRFDGSNWVEIQQIDAGPVNKLDSRLSSQLAEIEQDKFKASLVNHKDNKRLIAVWQDDDGRAGIYTKLAPIAREYSIVISAAIYTNGKHGFPIKGLPAHDPTYISYEQMVELYEEGIIEYLSHTHNHVYLDSKTDEEIHYELKTSRDILKRLGWNYKDFVYPGGRNDENIRYITSKYYESAFKVGNVLPEDGPYDQYAMPRVTIPNRDYDVEDKKREIDKLLDRFGFVVFMTHADLDAGIDVNKFKQLIEYTQSKGVEFCTTRELMREHGHTLQQGNNIITAGGVFYGDDLGVFKKDDKAPYNAPITYFDKGKTTRTRISQDAASSYNIPPGANPSFGQLSTIRDFQQDIFSVQFFYDRNNFRTLMRRWHITNNIWTDWEVLGEGYVDLVDGYPLTSPITNFPKGKVVKLRIPQNGATTLGIPAQVGLVPYGFMEVHRDKEQDEYSSQVFYDVRNNLIYMRKWVPSSSNWTSWYRSGGFYSDAGIKSNDPPITDFAKGTVTKIKILQDSASVYNIPQGNNPPYGFIDVHRDRDDDTFSLQVFSDIRNKRILMRSWLKSVSKWGDWEIANS